jgi:hypothetical protein
MSISRNALKKRKSFKALAIGVFLRMFGGSATTFVSTKGKIQFGKEERGAKSFCQLAISSI